MSTVDEFFSVPAESILPRVRYWKKFLEDSSDNSAALEIYWPEAAFGQSEPEMYLHLAEAGKPLPLESFPWDDDLNAGLIDLGVRAINFDDETKRFALGLRAAFRKASRRYGDGYFNAVLCELLVDSGFTEDRQIADVFKHAYANRPHREGTTNDNYTTCRELISDAIKARLPELTDQLKYSPDDAKRILMSAIARYLDDRFSVSSRRKLGLL